MSNPLDVEYRYQTISRVLEYPMSARKRCLFATSFLESLPEKWRPYQSYVLQLCQAIGGWLVHADFTGVDPARLESILALLLKARAEVDDVQKIEGFDEAIDHLKAKVARQFIHVNRNEDAWRVAQGISIPTTLADTSQAPDPRAQTVLVPVVERSLEPGDDVTIGGVRRISLRFTSVAPGSQDHLHADVAVLGDGLQNEDPHAVPLTAARRMFVKNHPHKTLPFLEGTISFDQRYAVHSGASAHLGIAASAFCAFLEFTDQRGLYSVLNDAVLSGAIDDSGTVLAVEEQSLSAKVRAVFFSSARTLAVPKDQLHLALAEVSSLKERYPDRRLQVVGISHLEEVFFDRRLTDYRHISVARHVGRKAKRNIAIVLLTSALLLAGAYLFWRYAAPISPNPVVVEFMGDQMMIRNGLGQTIDAPQVGVTTVQRHTEMNKSSGRDPLLDIADVDGDGYNEVIYVQYGRSLLEEPDMLVCYDVVERKRIWSKPMFQDISFPHKPEVLDNRYRVVDLHVGGRSYGRIDFLVVAANHFVFFPSVVMTLDPLTGELLQRYVHMGQLAAAEFADLDDDGDLELIAAGGNNAFGMAAVMGLDPEHLEGHSPTSGDYDPAGVEEGHELFYVLIPRTIVGNAFRTVHGINGAGSMVLYQDAKRFEVNVQDVGGVDGEGKWVEAQLHYYFDFAGIPIAVGPSSAYDAQAKLLFHEGKIPTLPDKTYFESYLGLLRRWDRGTWVQARPTALTAE